MSLEALNAPPLVTAAGAALFAALPFLDHISTILPWSTLKVANTVAFGINVLAVSRPGRIDGQPQEQQHQDDEGNKDNDAPSEMDRLSPGRSGRTLVAPAGWAFAIWGPIYLGEMAMVASQWLLLDESSSSPTRAILQEASAPFVVANVFQSLWCASFRPKYNKGFYMYLSWAMLTGTAFSLSKVHETYSYSSSSNNGVSFGQYCLYFLPLSLHFGWTTAASLVNLNGAVALNPSASPRVVAWVGHATVIGASALGAAISLTRSAPVFGGVITWALLAVADGMKQRLQSTEKKNDDKTEITGTYGAKTQLQLSRIGALVSGLAALTATIQLWTGSN